MKKFAAVIGDPHLKDKIWSNRPIHGDSYFVWGAAIDIAIENEVEVVILPGDILDKQSNNSKPIAQLKAGLDRLHAAGIQVAYIQGQHCMADPPWPSVSTNAVHLHRNSIEVDGYTIAGIDFQAKERLQTELSWVSETLKADPAKTILVMHQVWSPWMPDFTLPQGNLDDVSGFIPELGLLVTGDLHEWKTELTAEGLVALSPGSMCMQSIAEPEDKYVTLLGRCDEYGTPDMKKVRLPTRPFIDWPFLGVVSDIEAVIREFDEVFDQTQLFCEHNSMPDEMCVPLVRFRYDHSLSGDIHRLEKLVRGRGHIFWKELAPTVSDGELSAYELGVQAGLGAMQTMTSVLSSVECDEAVREVAERLLSGGNPEEELQRWRKEQVEADSHGRLVDEYERS